MAFSSDGGAPDAAMPGAPDAGASLDGGMSMTAAAPRIHLTPYTDLHASLWLYKTCPDGNAAGAGDRWLDRVSELRQRRAAGTVRRTSAIRFTSGFRDQLR